MTPEELQKLHALLNKGPMDTDRKLNIWRQIVESIYIPGDVIEIGCYQGATAALMRFLMDTYCPRKKLHVYDGFRGLHGRNESKDQGGGSAFANGEFLSSMQDVLDLFSAYSLQHPQIYERLVQDITPDMLPENISMAHIDLDLYQPMLDAFKLVWPRMTNGAILVIDDYDCPATKGVKQAVLEFFDPEDRERITTPVPKAAVLVKRFAEWGNRKK